MTTFLISSMALHLLKYNNHLTSISRKWPKGNENKILPIQQVILVQQLLIVHQLQPALTSQDKLRLITNYKFTHPNPLTN